MAEMIKRLNVIDGLILEAKTIADEDSLSTLSYLLAMATLEINQLQDTYHPFRGSLHRQFRKRSARSFRMD